MQIAVICKIKTNISEIRKASPPPFSTEISPLYMCCNIHHFGITKRKVMASKLQVTPTKLQVTPTKLQVSIINIPDEPESIINDQPIVPNADLATGAKLPNTCKSNKETMRSQSFTDVASTNTATTLKQF